MKYLTAEELLESDKDYSHEILEKCVGKSVRDNFAFQVFDSSLKKKFDGKTGELEVLDLGSASGGFAQQMSENGYRNIHGTDLDDYVIPQNKGWFRDFKKSDLSWERIPWPNGSFDVAAAWCVLPHLENPFHCIREVSRVLKKGGIFIFTAPYLASKPSMDYFIKHKDFGSYRAGNNHLVLFPKGVVEKSVLKYFDLIDVEYHFRTKIFKGWHGAIRKILYKTAKSAGDKWRKKIAQRWAYSIFYVAENK